MWRIFKEIPKNVRQWNNSIRSTPSGAQNSRRDEEHTDDQHAPHNILSQQCVQQIRRYHRYKNAERYEQGTDHDRKEWKTHFDHWKTTRQQQCILEIIGLGAAFAFGLNVSKTVHQINKQNAGEEKNGLCPTLATICRLAMSMPLSRSVLPDTDNKQHDTSAIPENESPIKANILEQAWLEFQDLTKLHRATTFNIQGLQHKNAHAMNAAVNKWEAGSELGHSKSQYNLGLSYELGRGTSKNLKKAADMYTLASDSGHGLASYNLAMMYMEGTGGLQKDSDKAFELIKKAADAEVSQAQTYLGIYYTEENCKDLNKAASYFKSASAQKDTDSQYFLGLCYENGWGVEQNECKATSLFSEAAKKGHADALFNLGIFHENGMGGLMVDTATALSLYCQAEENGSTTAKFNRQRLEAISTLECLTSKYSSERTSQTGDITNTHNHNQSNESLRSCASSPTLGDFAKEHFSDFHVSGLDKVASMSNTDLPSLKNDGRYEAPGIDSTITGISQLMYDIDWDGTYNKPMFSLGDDADISDAESDDSIMFLDDPAKGVHPWLGIQRNPSSLNNIGCIS